MDIIEYRIKTRAYAKEYYKTHKEAHRLAALKSYHKHKVAKKKVKHWDWGTTKAGNTLRKPT